MSDVPNYFAVYSAREEQLNDVRQAARTLADKFDLAYWRECDKESKYPWDFVNAFAEAGWMGIMMPEEYGGMGLGLAEAAVMLREIGASGAGMSGASAMHFYVFPPAPILRHGSEDLKRRALPGFVNGTTLMAFGVTEPTAGVDTSRIKTRAEKKGDRWIINGQKVWSTNAQNATKYLILARTSPRDEKRPLDGMTLFYADLDRKHCEVRVIDKLGRAAVDSNEVFIDGLEVPEENVIGEVGKGFSHLLDGLNPERVVVAMEAIGIGYAALDMAVQYANERVVFDRPIGKNQAVANPLAECWMRLQGAESVALHAAMLYDNHQSCGPQANTAKFLGADAGYQACDQAMQTHGGFAYAKEYHIERLWREVRLLRLAPVSQEMVCNFVAHKVLGLPKSY
ncbi:acyl-CoA dehydrogenase family protein [Allopusillimonas ginsengisoli]|uniref:acyl-CoA dehydrogenase family protein n=1 Tax=Allopusillimonas ginsengisoli TaxID=453575 RepID=UPI001021B040|nr:acyl-CoA dehydrogenase family protein [Allopusillimonas ginsengisoli]TEA71904.1 acyl-CoA dehydrogenase [Allopusillimonas ginsengisoli]